MSVITSRFRRKAGNPKSSADAMTLVAHLEELRRRLMWCALALVGAGIIVFALYNRIFDLMVSPYCDLVRHTKGFGVQGGTRIVRQCSLVTLSPLEGFSVRLRVAGYGGVVLASPVLLYHLWRFITPGLHKNEKRYAVPFVAASVLLFVSGCAVAVLTIPEALKFLVAVGGNHVTPLYAPGPYIHLVTLMMLAFGISFEFPVLLVFLELVGILSSSRLRKTRRIAAVSIVAAAAVLTPSQDPISLFMMAIPLYVFYEAAIVIGRLLKK